MPKFDLRGSRARKKPFLSKKNIRARLQFTNDHIGNGVLWTDESKVELSNMFDGHQRQVLSRFGVTLLFQGPNMLQQ